MDRGLPLVEDPETETRVVSVADFPGDISKLAALGLRAFGHPLTTSNLELALAGLEHSKNTIVYTQDRLGNFLGYLKLVSFRRYLDKKLGISESALYSLGKRVGLDSVYGLSIIAVEPAAQGRGIGKRLLATMVRQLDPHVIIALTGNPGLVQCVSSVLSDQGFVVLFDGKTVPDKSPNHRHESLSRAIALTCAFLRDDPLHPMGRMHTLGTTDIRSAISVPEVSGFSEAIQQAFSRLIAQQSEVGASYTVLGSLVAVRV